MKTPKVLSNSVPLPEQGPPGIFAQTLLDWQRLHGRQTLPWQNTGSAYRVWLSEVMLQQTQVSTVLGYYARFLEAFPTVADLACAPDEQVMHLWQGLGYYSRARNLHACARQVVERFGGEFPRSVAELESLPGIGLSTAGAIASLAYGVQAPILDGNVKRVFCRYFGVEGYPEQSAVKKRLWAIASAEVPAQEPGRYNQALMDLGATVCTPKSPRCSACPLAATCVALRQGRTTHLPEPKPKKERPHWYFLALIVRDAQGRVLLTQQGDTGLWRTLWMPPCVQLASKGDDLNTASQELLAGLHAHGAGKAGTGLPHADWQSQPWLIHDLTHRKLHFKTLVLEHSPGGPSFYAPTEKALPRLVHKLLDSVQGAVPDQNTLDFT